MPGRIGRAAVVAGAAAVVLALPGCATRTPSPESFDASLCRGEAGDANLPSRVSYMEGDFALRLSAASGTMAGRSTFGDLTLVRRDSAGVPLYGWTDLDPEEVGAQRVGDPASRALEAPGVLVLADPVADRQSGDGPVTLRLGSQANRSDIIRFDGAFTALYVRWIDRDAFGGDWASGVQGPEASGSFCALRDGVPN
jgi:hypothetical protein